jgi:hypothetical protein
VAESSSPDHQRRSVVAGGLGVLLAQQGQPVNGRPARSVGRVDHDDRKVGVAGHLAEAVSELAGGDGGDHAPEALAASAACGPVPGALAALGAGLFEVQVLNHYGAGACVLGGGDEGGDRGAQVPVPGGRGEPGQVQGYLELSCQPVL